MKNTLHYIFLRICNFEFVSIYFKKIWDYKFKIKILFTVFCIKLFFAFRVIAIFLLVETVNVT